MTMTAPTTGWYADPAVERTMAAAMPEPKNDPFYKYEKPLEKFDPGTVLRHRTIKYYFGGVPTPVKAVQLLYRSTSQTQKATVNVTSVIPPPIKSNKTKVVSYQSAYDSLNQGDEPSYSISGGKRLSGLIASVELAVFGPLLADGYTIIVPDIEGQEADFAAGPEYGMNTLDSIRAAFSKKSTLDFPDNATVAMLGYSGGALATEWAAELAPTYAPDVNKRLNGAAMGGLLVHPAHNLHYIEDTWFWGGVMLMALVGITRTFDIERDIKKYLSTNGVKLFDNMKTKSIINVLGQYGDPQTKKGLKWTDLAKPEYPTPERIPRYVECVNRLIMGTGGHPERVATPTIPLFIGQGANGELEGTPGNKPRIGAGDGVMIAGDVRTLARGYYANGATVWYEQYDECSHISSLLIWIPHAIAWIKQRFAGVTAPQNGSSIPQGNPLDPIKLQSPAPAR
ncbi:MAG TPA: lipase family protein [Mycobacterium sp.]|nr:lipase family protein [Mycobacterium sp.]HTX96633.1 lipase family protein [Mycobacterium sp.]